MGITITFCVGLSALLASTDRAMRRPLECGTGNRTGSTFFMLLDVEPITNLAAFWEPGRTNGTLIPYSQQSDGAD